MKDVTLSNAGGQYVLRHLEELVPAPLVETLTDLMETERADIDRLLADLEAADALAHRFERVLADVLDAATEGASNDDGEDSPEYSWIDRWKDARAEIERLNAVLCHIADIAEVALK